MHHGVVRRRHLLPVAGALVLVAVVVAVSLLTRTGFTAASWTRDIPAQAKLAAKVIPGPDVTSCTYRPGLLTEELTINWTLAGQEYGPEDAKVKVDGQTLNGFNVDGATTPEAGGTYTTTLTDVGLLQGVLGEDGRLSLLVAGERGWTSAPATVAYADNGLLQPPTCQPVPN